MKTNTALKRRSLKNVLDTLNVLSHSIEKGFSVLDHLLGVVAIILLCLSLTGCATTKEKPEALSLECKPPKIVQLRFKRLIKVTPPEKDPVTTDEHIRCGLFYFDQEKFVAAANEFEKARNGISGRQNPLYRACLMSAAVCHLLADNKPAFMQTIKDLKSTYNRYELIVVKDSDDSVKVLYELYDKVMKTGNF